MDSRRDDPRDESPPEVTVRAESPTESCSSFLTFSGLNSSFASPELLSRVLSSSGGVCSPFPTSSAIGSRPRSASCTPEGIGTSVCAKFDGTWLDTRPGVSAEASVLRGGPSIRFVRGSLVETFSGGLVEATSRCLSCVGAGVLRQGPMGTSHYRRTTCPRRDGAPSRCVVVRCGIWYRDWWWNPCKKLTVKDSIRNPRFSSH